MESIRIAVVGGGVGGKSTFVLHYITGAFDPNVGPMFEEEYKKTIQIPDFDLVDANSPTVMLEILDTPGQEEYSAMRDQYMREAQGFLVVYSVTSKATFDETPTFIGQILRVKDAEHGEVPIILLANKMDEPSNLKQVTSEEGMKYAVDCKIPFIEASAKTGQNIANAFIDLSKLTIENRKKYPEFFNLIVNGFDIIE